ncbi:hypothetical protein B7463_g8578, partial [Scytalidium lignicola]
MAGWDPATVASVAALIVACLALLIAAAQALQQYFITGQLIRMCDSVVYGPMPGQGHRIWQLSQFRFRVIYSIPQISLRADLWPTKTPFVKSYAVGEHPLPPMSGADIADLSSPPWYSLRNLATVFRRQSDNDSISLVDVKEERPTSLWRPSSSSHSDIQSDDYSVEISHVNSFRSALRWFLFKFSWRSIKRRSDSNVSVVLNFKDNPTFRSQLGEASWVSFCRAIEYPCGESVRFDFIEYDADRCPVDLVSVPMQVSMRDIIVMCLTAGMEITSASFQDQSISMQGAPGTLTSSKHPVLGPILHFTTRVTHDSLPGAFGIGRPEVRGVVDPCWLARTWDVCYVAQKFFNWETRRTTRRLDDRWIRDQKGMYHDPTIRDGSWGTEIVQRFSSSSETDTKFRRHKRKGKGKRNGKRQKPRYRPHEKKTPGKEQPISNTQILEVPITSNNKILRLAQDGHWTISIPALEPEINLKQKTNEQKTDEQKTEVPSVGQENIQPHQKSQNKSTSDDETNVQADREAEPIPEGLPVDSLQETASSSETAAPLELQKQNGKPRNQDVYEAGEERTRIDDSHHLYERNSSKESGPGTKPDNRTTGSTTDAEGYRLRQGTFVVQQGRSIEEQKETAKPERIQRHATVEDDPEGEQPPHTGSHEAPGEKSAYSDHERTAKSLQAARAERIRQIQRDKALVEESIKKGTMSSPYAEAARNVSHARRSKPPRNPPLLLTNYPHYPESREQDSQRKEFDDTKDEGTSDGSGAVGTTNAEESARKRELERESERLERERARDRRNAARNNATQFRFVDMFWICQMNVMQGFWATPWQHPHHTPIYSSLVGAIRVVLEALLGFLDKKSLLYTGESGETLSSFRITANWMFYGNMSYPGYAHNARGGVIAEGRYIGVCIPAFTSVIPALQLLYSYDWQVSSGMHDQMIYVEEQNVELMRIDAWLSYVGRTPEIANGPHNLLTNTPSLIQLIRDEFELDFSNIDLSAEDGGLQDIQDLAVNVMDFLTDEELNEAEQLYILVALLRAVKVAQCLRAGSDTSQLHQILERDIQAHLV